MPNNEQKFIFRNKYGIQNNYFVIVYAGKLDQFKGGLLLANALKDKINTNDGVPLIFLIVGNTVGEYGEKIESIFASSENKIFRFPTQKYKELAKFYQSADLAVFPQQCSLSFFDVQACGIPVIIEDNSINIKRVSHGNGLTFKAGDVDDLRVVIKKCANMNASEFNLMKDNSLKFIISEYDYKNIVLKYNHVLEEEIEKFK
jgi:glycosyltransferase involved in cell wall biosynthesis